MGNIASRGLFFGSIFCALALLNSCGGGGGGGSGTTGAPTSGVQTGTATGTVIDGPISGALVEIYDFTGNVRGLKLGSGITDSSGNYSITLSPRPTGPVIVVASGGSYTEEATGALTNLTSADTFTEIVAFSSVSNGNLTAHVNPLSHIAANMVATASGTLGVENAILLAKSTLSQQYGVSVTDLGANAPISASNPSLSTPPTMSQRQAGALMAGISELARSLQVRTPDLVKALGDDFSDGKLDGKKGSAAISIPRIGGGTVTLTATAALGDLQNATTTFLGSQRNNSGLTSLPPIKPQPIDAPVSTSGAVFVKTDVIPPFFSGISKTVQLQAAGGTPPYNWTGLTGCPSGVTVSSAGALTATGVSFPGNTGMSVSQPCEVTVSDTRGQSAKFTFRITSVAGIGMSSGTLGPIEKGKPTTITAASAGGGAPPYFFFKAADAVLPPGMSVTTSSDQKNGLLTGTPTQTGTYVFNICVSDVAGSSACVPASLTVNDPPTAKLTITTAGSGAGSVTPSPAGIACGTSCQSYAPGSQVILTAAPGNGSTFAGWTGANCSGTGTCAVTLQADTTVTATFNTATSSTFNLTKATAGTGSGSLTTSPAGASCGTNCVSFAAGTSVTLTASPASGSTFAGWSGGGCSGTATTCTTTLSSNQTVTATFNTGLTGTWIGGWQWTGPGISSTGQIGCTFNDGGAFTINITQSGTSFSGTASGDGIQTRNFSQGCALVSTDPGSGSISGTISGSNVTVGFDLSGLIFSGTATFDGTTLTATFARTTGGAGSFSVTRQGSTGAAAFTNGANSATGTSYWRRSLTQSTEEIAFYADHTGFFKSGGTCATGTITWSQTSSTSISVNLPATTGFSNECPRIYTFTNISVGGGQFSGTLNRGTGGSPVTYTAIGGHI